MSPVGALNNGIELLADETDPDMREKCTELLADSARATANKLKFFRLAFGAGGGFGEEIDTAEARAVLEGLFGAEGKIELGWVVDGDKLPKGAVKLLLNLALLAGDALVRGGRLDVGAERTGRDIELAVRAEGPRILLDPVLRDTLTTGGRGSARTASRKPSGATRTASGSRPGSRRRRSWRSPSEMVTSPRNPGAETKRSTWRHLRGGGT